MNETGHSCGQLYALYAAARAGAIDRMQELWQSAESTMATVDGATANRIGDAVDAGDAPSVRTMVADVLFCEPTPARLDGRLAKLVGAVLYGFGYVASFGLFFRTDSPTTVVRRLRWAYRTVGVDIQDTETVDGTERTVFRCPYRTLGADRWGPKHVCHDVLDRVDDGYVTFLHRHRGLEYNRPRACAGSECCYSVVSEL